MNTVVSQDAPSRRRLPPERRVQEILDAALVEFSARGYGATRMDDIAARAGLSKGGLYAHFASKEDMLAALLELWLKPTPIDPEAMLDGVCSLRELSCRFVDCLYEALSQPAVMTTFRLLMAEGWRVPEVMERWRSDAQLERVALARLIELAAARGLCANRAARHSWLLLSPVVHALMVAMITGDPQRAREPEWRAGHIEMMCALLAAA
ncbi:TetR family transcriptional regulator [Bordetella trematum]|uniref:TetR family transcriptional regulator n=1 Tax=Bordetella trematum TaxID=123899 RepID=A0A157SQT2_9BORD|nr:TetR/AcrR family transcriptional regulator [Bordetella trematum]AUL47279.1 TetR family transcriptional regulator [Bordetella trematum]AZR94144.1 TetR family transcriptional regulator [Bordetella trematum]NNH20500.1 TetR/AcrR family transcriptional regulator [Bordetella trematum]QIM72683.1 TetR/AcrR family transcriptional regulator [Bordetella trematum]SAH77380.1 TetR family transcriptional regulator [Bordetella trematum]